MARVIVKSNVCMYRCVLEGRWHAEYALYITNFSSLFVSHLFACSHALILEKLVIERKAPTELVCILFIV